MEDDFLKEEEWPKTVKEAIEKLKEMLSEKDLEAIRNMKENELIQLHFSLGLFIRNQFGLWQGNNSLIRDALRVSGEEVDEGEIMIVIPDRISGIIIEEFWKDLHR